MFNFAGSAIEKHGSAFQQAIVNKFVKYLYLLEKLALIELPLS